MPVTKKRHQTKNATIVQNTKLNAVSTLGKDNIKKRYTDMYKKL